MNLKFWQKNSESGVPSKPGEVKLPGPKSMPETVGRYLVVRLGKEPDWVWGLKSLARPHPEDKNVFDVRIFDETRAGSKNVIVKNYTSLDEHPELILFEGWYDKKTMKVEVKAKEMPIAHAA